MIEVYLLYYASIPLKFNNFESKNKLLTVMQEDVVHKLTKLKEEAAKRKPLRKDLYFPRYK